MEAASPTRSHIVHDRAASAATALSSGAVAAFQMCTRARGDTYACGPGWASPQLGNAPVEGRHNPGDQSQILRCADGRRPSAQPGCRVAVGCTLRHAEGEYFRQGPGPDACFELRQLVNSRPIPLPCALLPRMHGRHPWVGPLVRLRQPLPSGRQACKAGNKPGRNLRGNRRGHRPRAAGRPPTALPTPSRVVQSGPVWALKVPVLRGSGLRAVGLAAAAFPRRRGGHGDFPSRGINPFEDSSLTHEPNSSPPKRIRRVGGGLRPLEGIQLPAFGGFGIFAGSLSSFIRLVAVPQGVPDTVRQDLPGCLVLVALHVRSG